MNQMTPVSAASPQFRNNQTHFRAMEFDLIRGDIDCSALIEQALFPVFPGPKEFPYVVNALTQVVSGDGAQSMSAVASSSVALADGGVPITCHVAGSTVGILKTHSGKDAVVHNLVDTLCMEEDIIDGKVSVAGARGGLTLACLNGVRSSELSLETVIAAVQAAESDALPLLDRMDAISPLNREPETLQNRTSCHAKTRVPKETIGRVIGPGGSKIKWVESETVSIFIYLCFWSKWLMTLTFLRSRTGCNWEHTRRWLGACVWPLAEVLRRSN